MNTTESSQLALPRTAVRTSTGLPVRRSRMRDAAPRVRRPPKWSARVLPRRVA